MAIDLIQHAGDGLPGLWEPLRRTSEGARILAKPGSDFKRQQVRCLFSEDPSSPSSGCGGVNVILKEVLDSLKNATAVPSHPPVVLKTTRIVNLGLLAEELSPEQLQGAKFVVLVRDPRAIWASFKPFAGWAIHSIPLVCRLLAESLLTVPALADAAPGRVEVVMYEEWSKDLARFAEQMGSFFGLDSAGMVRFGREKQREPGAPGWVSSLSAREISYIERDRFCRAYMDRVGYKPGNMGVDRVDRAAGADYSRLRSSADLQRGLDHTEQSLLAELMSIEEFNPYMSQILRRT
jgi:hypothetical protein